MELHPTPQFARSSWFDLDGEWSFQFDDANIGISDQWMDPNKTFERTIIVPFPPESIASGIHETGFHPVIWYQRSFRLPDTYKKGQRLILHFGAVDYSAMVWVNGQFVGQHRGGHTPFFFDITDQLTESEEQSIVVRAEDWPQDLAQPRGKQGWEKNPRTIWYHRTSGIWQPVWLEVVNAFHIEELRWKTNIDTFEIDLAISLNQKPQKPFELGIRLSMGGEMVASDRIVIQNSQVERKIILSFDDAHIHSDKYLWSPEHPNLVDAVITLLDGEMEIDKVKSYTGLRSVSGANHRFQLNGHPYYLRMVLSQGYWPQSYLAAPSADAIREEVRLIKNLGFNGVRIHQKVEDPRFLYWCDQMGVIVWGEMANTYVFSPEAVTRLISEWMEVIKRDYNHPSVVAWVPVNESWGVPSAGNDAQQRAFLRAVYWLTKSFDTERLVIDNDGWEHVTTDILSIHDYDQSEQVMLARYGSQQSLDELLLKHHPNSYQVILPDNNISKKIPIMLTEFGGMSYERKNGEDLFTYGTVSTDEEYIDKLRALISAVVSCSTLSGYCYTQLTDTEQERNGLLTENREPKLTIEELCLIFRMQGKGGNS
jgi:beta-galactosidase/beta-glucuronidase